MKVIMPDNTDYTRVITGMTNSFRRKETLTFNKDMKLWLSRRGAIFARTKLSPKRRQLSDFEYYEEFAIVSDDVYIEFLITFK